MPVGNLISVWPQIGVVYGNPEVTTGGNALKFFCSVRVDVRRAKAIEGPKQEQIGIRVKAKVMVLLQVAVQSIV